MKEGAWLNARTGEWAWIGEHATWIMVPENACRLGMAKTAALQLSQMPVDFNGPGRRTILRAAMAQGFIRVRGHGVDVTFEHTMHQAEAMVAARSFMASNFGPMTWCRFTNVMTMEMIEIAYQVVAGHLADLQVLPPRAESRPQ